MFIVFPLTPDDVSLTIVLFQKHVQGWKKKNQLPKQSKTSQGSKILFSINTILCDLTLAAKPMRMLRALWL